MKPKRFFFHQPQVFGMPLRCGVPLVLGFMVFITGLDAEAGDILRGGAGGGGAKPKSATTGGPPTPAATDAARANARDMLARTNRTLDAMRAMQNAARNAAKNGPNNLGKNPANPSITLPNVPNGLVTGGLKVSPLAATDPTKWTGAKLPTQTVSKGKTKVTINQTEQQALLHWETLNVGKKTTLTFDQSEGGENVGQWIAFNKVSDPSANPTQILGNIKADGQIYIINSNGIIFGGSSQVNARGLTVSSLPINDNLVAQGLLNNRDAQFLFSGLDIPAGVNGTPAFSPEKPADPAGRYGDVIVQEGAVLRSPTNSANVGGRIALVGSNVTNAGSILTPDGQTILAAGLQVGLVAHSASDPSLRGLDVIVGQVDATGVAPYAGSVNQAGLVESPRGNITLSGRTISQNGVLESSTSTSLNGRIDINASYDAIRNPDNTALAAVPFLFRASGNVSFGNGSLARILPEYASNEKAIGTELALNSAVNVTGRAIHLDRNSIMLAPSADIRIAAGEWKLTGAATAPIARFVRSTGQIYLDAGAIINVAGSIDVVVPVSQNIIEVDLRGSELADSPLQRDGDLRNQTIYVDIRDAGVYKGQQWQGTPLANVEGFANLIERDVGQLTTAGGTVNLSAGGSVVMRNGSIIDVSGGSTFFEGGMIRTSRLLTGGRIVDISQASPDMIYQGLFGGTFTVVNSKFQVSETYVSQLAPAGYRFESSASQGAAGGALSISAPSMALQGKLAGKTFAGFKQRETPPSGSSLNISLTAQDASFGTLPLYAPTPPELVFRQRPDQAEPLPFSLDVNGDAVPLQQELLDTLELSSRLFTSSGFGSVAVDNPDGDVIVPDNVTLSANAGGASLTLSGSNIRIDGSIILPSGTVSFRSSNLSLATLNQLNNSTGNVLPLPTSVRGLFTLGSSGVIDTSGVVLDDRSKTSRPRFPYSTLNGGSVTIESHSAALLQGGRIDVSGGVYVSPINQVSYGDAGAIRIDAGNDPNLPALLGGTLSLGSKLTGFSGSGGGVLSITAPAMRIGGSSTSPGVVALSSEFFNAGGFGTFELSSSGLASVKPGSFEPGMVIDSAADIHPEVISLEADTRGGDLVLRRILNPEGIRPAGAISFSASGQNDPYSGAILGIGETLIEEGASIVTDARGSLSLRGTTVTVLGNIRTPGGKISLTGESRFPTINPDTYLPTVLVGSGARISAAGKLLLVPNALGYRQGSVLAGGTVSLTGNIVTESGASINVSGASGILDLPPSSATLDTTALNSFGGKVRVPVRVDSNGGRITFSGSQLLYSDARLIGAAGGDSAIGATVSVSSGRFIPVNTAFTSADPSIVVRQGGSIVPEGFAKMGSGSTLADSAGKALPGIGNFNVESFSGGGFDSLTLAGNVRFESEVKLSLPGTLRLASGGAIYASGKVVIDAGGVVIGQDFTPPSLPSETVILFTQRDVSGNETPYTFAPTAGSGSLRVTARHADIGNLSLQGIGDTRFIVPKGDLRGDGTLSVAGDLVIRAGQIHPTTAGTFNIFTYDPAEDAPGSVKINQGSTRDLPLSAGGEIGIFASEIDIFGTIRSPMGTVNLGWSGTRKSPFDPIAGTTTPAPQTRELTLYESSFVSVSAINRDGSLMTLPYGISLNGSTWIDPTGTDITLAGAPQKNINLAADDLVTEEGSVLDVRGGGDLYAYRWISGAGGTVDILQSNSAFAILPGYDGLAVPFAPFNPSSAATELGGANGYVNPNLKIGDQITLGAGKGFPAGTYTLLPARYALLPGAFLINPVGGSPANSVKAPDKAQIVSGYVSNGLDSSRHGPTAITRFEIANSKVIRDRAEYVDFLATPFLSNAALVRELERQRLPLDAGRVSFSANDTATIRGGLSAAPADNGLGALVDIDSAGSILINRSGRGGAAGDLVLSTRLLNSFNAESLLVGGSRETVGETTLVDVTATSITVDTDGAKLRGEDIILTADQRIDILSGSRIESETTGIEPADLTLGDPELPGSGNGLLARVSGASGGEIHRFSVADSTSSVLRLESGAKLRGREVTLDSTSKTLLGNHSVIQARSLGLGSGRISMLLDQPGTLGTDPGLVLSDQILKKIGSTSREISFRSYSSFDIYGNGDFGSSKTDSMSFASPVIRSIHNGGEGVSFRADLITLSAPEDSFSAGSGPATHQGTLEFVSKNIELGSGDVRIEGLKSTQFAADDQLTFIADGSLVSTSNLILGTPVVTGTSAAGYRIESAATISFSRPHATTSDSSGGFGASLEVEARSVSINSDILLASGNFSARATAGNVILGNGATLRVDGSRVRLAEVDRFTNAGRITLASTTGNVSVLRGSTISAAGLAGGGNAGMVSIDARNGTFTLNGTIAGSANSSSSAGSFQLDVSQIADGNLTALDATLNAGGFNTSRDYHLRTGDVTIGGAIRSRSYRVTTDGGDLTVIGNINSSGDSGGTIDLKSAGSLTVASGAKLNVAASDFDAAGKGGAVILEAGNAISGVANESAILDLQAGSTIDLSVATNRATSPQNGKFTGTLHLRAPRTGNNTDIAINAIGSTIREASSILVEGSRVYSVAGTGTITTTLQNTIRNDARIYLGAAGTPSAAYTNMLGRLTSLQPDLDLILAPGVEIVNLTGDLTLGTDKSAASSDWNLNTWRFGARSAPGVLTLRAAEDLVFFNALSDGFSGASSLWLSPLTAFNPLLPANSQSWSFRLAAGADLASASFRSTQPIASLAPGTGMLDLGKNAGSATVTGGTNARTSSLISNLYQVIRTGSGNIDIQTGGGVRLLNPFASIYTAGTRLENPTDILAIGDFTLPKLDRNVQQGNLGSAQQNYLAQYSMAGGNVTIHTSGNLERKTRNNSGLIDDSSRQLPNNWLYRRSYLGADGTAGKIRIGTGFTATTDPAASTTWWVDFSNFFQTVGALGGGNISLSADGSIQNFDAAIPTNARTAAGAPTSAGYVELGGGNLSVSAAGNISGGVYYVERGSGSLQSGGSITTNSTRSPSFGLVGNLNNPPASILDSRTWMPTTLFVGKSSFTATASGDVLLGPVSNPFLLPQGIGNRFWYKSYFSTMAPDASVEVVSLGGTAEFRNAVTLANQSQAIPALLAWHQTQLQLTNSPSSTAWFQPWLRLAETDTTPFAPVWSLSAPNVSITSITSDINLAGDLTTFPAPKGQIELIAAGSINAFQPTGLSNQLSIGSSVQSWVSSTINHSDSDPGSIPGIFSPLTSVTESLTGAVVASSTVTGFMEPLSTRLTESGSFTGINASLQTRQGRHTQGGLHRGDDNPLLVYALGGDVSGLTLFSAKQSRIIAARDITDVAFYLQNNHNRDNSVVTAGRDIVAFNGNTPLRTSAAAAGNSPAAGEAALAGDIQIAGPGTLQVLAGGNIDLGVGSNNPDGTGTGISSIGNLRNPYLPTTGAGLVVGAGLDSAASLASSNLDFESFVESYVLTSDGRKILAKIAPGIDFETQSQEQQARLAMEVFYRILRDTGRNFNNPKSPDYQDYDSGLDAIATLFPESVDWSGEILTQSRDIRTKSGGGISIFVPGGGLTMSEAAVGNTLAPPGIITESGGNVAIFAHDSVSIGIGRIFTLRGGDIMIWSSEGDIAAGSSSRTVQSAPPTRVVVDPQSAAVQTDLAGLATGGGIGVLATVEGVPPGDVDLIAPTGVIDAGDAGIRVSGNINLAAITVVNSANISAGGSSSGTPSAVSAPSISTVTSASNSAAASSATAAKPPEGTRDDQVQPKVEEMASEFTVTVIGYGGGSPEEDEDEEDEEDEEEEPNDEGDDATGGAP